MSGSAKETFVTSGCSSEGFFEAVLHKNKPYFMIANAGSSGETLYETLKVDGVTFKPKILNVPNLPFLFPSNYIVKPEVEHLFEAIYKQFDTYVNCPKEQKMIGSAFVLASYQQEKFDTFTYFGVSGAPDTGKSIFGEIIALLSYYGWFAVSEHAANIYQFLHDIKPSVGVIVEDEIQGLEKDLDKMKIYKSGYTNNTSVGRINLKPRMQEYYPTGCQKGLIGEYQILDPALKSRTIEFQMFRGEPKGYWRNGRSQEDKFIFQGLHSSLLLWRLRNKSANLSKTETGLTGRLGEIWNPLVWSIPEALQPELIKIAKSMHLSAEEENETEMEMRVYNVLQNFIDEQMISINAGASMEIPFGDLCDTIQSELGVNMPDVFKPHLIMLKDYGELSKTQLGKILKRRFKCSTKNKQNTWMYKFYKTQGAQELED
jgi:hypothetical protein